MPGDYLNAGKAVTVRKLNKIIDDLKSDMGKQFLRSDELQEIIDSLERIKRGTEEPKIKPLALYLDMIDMIRKQASLPSNVPGLIHNAEDVYNALFLFDENTPEFEKTVEVFKVLAGDNGLVMRGFFYPYLFAAFSDKISYLTLVQVISRQRNALKIFDAIKTHAMEVRPYIIDEGAFLTYLLNMVSRLVNESPDSYGAFLDNELWKMQRSNGVYDIDPVRLAQVEKNVQKAALTVESGKNVLDTLELKSREMERVAGEIEERSKETARTTELYLDTKVKSAVESIEAKLKEYEAQQKESIHLEKEVFLKQLFSEAETELGKYKALAKTVTGSAAAEINSLSREADDVIRRIRQASDTDERLRDQTKKLKEDTELLERIAKLQVLNDSMIERLGKINESAEAEEVSSGKAEAAAEDLSPAVSAVDMAAAQSSASPAAVAASAVKTVRPIPSVNPLLDRNVPFKERFAIAMKEKERRIAQGELFHEMFDDVLTAVIEEVNPYLIGPSGCGKTYMVQQIGDLLNVDLSDIGYINEEYDILGYVTAMGEYSESNFYRLYKYGGIAFCDELDNGNSKATVKLNSFLSNHVHASYCFPGGEKVEKHPNFRVVAAGNTDGNGADINYNTRERIEESVQQRMIPIYVGYDNRVEQAILRDYPDWFEFACAFRYATDRWKEVSGIPAQGIFTTRDAFRIRQYMDNGSFTPVKIMNYEFVQTKEPEYLAFLKDEIEKRLKKDSESYGIWQLFASEVDRVRRSGRKG
ncbi:MAG: AAA family ATPase [Lachnospiraceae bacterium]|nr:AAA family ATPase [Lachnospiraceae bacterium]